MFTLPLHNLLERMKSMLLACLIWLTTLTRLSSKNVSTISSSGWWKGVSERVWRTLKMSWTCSSHGLRNQRERYFLHYILYQSAKLHDELGISDVCKQSDPTRTSFWYRLCLIEKSQIHHEDIRLGKPGQWPLASRCEDRQDLRNFQILKLIVIMMLQNATNTWQVLNEGKDDDFIKDMMPTANKRLSLLVL